MRILCLLCGCSTLENILEVHIQYNHMIYRRSIIKALYNLHYPPVPKSNFCAVLKDLKNPIKPNPTLPLPSPTSLKRGKSQQSHKSPKKVKVGSPTVVVVEDEEEGKKAIKLKRPTPLRKKLHPNKEQFLDEDVNSLGESSKAAEAVEYDDVYTRFQEDEDRDRSIRKIRELQEKDLHCTLDRGTTVQCNTCGKWRILKDCQDPSLVPEVWVCSMNQDVSADSCSKEATILPDEEEDDLMDVKFGLGSIVWAKFQGFPFWPGMVDYCPEEEDTFLIDPAVSTTEAAKYHVVFFDKDSNVSRGWVHKDAVQRLTDPATPPKKAVLKNESVRQRYNTAKRMAEDALRLDLIARVDKYSFANLYTGRWGDRQHRAAHHTDKKDASVELEVDPRLVGLSCFKTPDKDQDPFHNRRSRSSETKKDKPSSLVAVEPTFTCQKCSKTVKLVKAFVENHLRVHRWTVRDYLDYYTRATISQPDLEVLRRWLQAEEYFETLAEVGKKKAGGHQLSKLIRRISSSAATLESRETSDCALESMDTVDSALESRATAGRDLTGEDQAAEVQVTQALDDSVTDRDDHSSNASINVESALNSTSTCSESYTDPESDADTLIESEINTSSLTKQSSIEKGGDNKPDEGLNTEDTDNPVPRSSAIDGIRHTAKNYPERTLSKEAQAHGAARGGEEKRKRLKKNLSQYKPVEVVILDEDTEQLTDQAVEAQDATEGALQAVKAEDSTHKALATEAQSYCKNAFEDNQSMLHSSSTCDANIASQGSIPGHALQEVNKSTNETLDASFEALCHTFDVGSPQEPVPIPESGNVLDRPHSITGIPQGPVLDLDCHGFSQKPVSIDDPWFGLEIPGISQEPVTIAEHGLGSNRPYSSSGISQEPVSSAEPGLGLVRPNSSAGISQEPVSSAEPGLGLVRPNSSAGISQEPGSTAERPHSSAGSWGEGSSRCSFDSSSTERSTNENLSAGEQKTEPIDAGYPLIPEFSKPHFSTDLLIALAIRNINKNIGAYMKDVIAFLCLFFPYYNNNRDECWKLVTRHVTGQPQSPGSRELDEYIVKAGVNLDRMSVYAAKFRCRIIKKSIVDIGFLEDLISRFVSSENAAAEDWRHPPFTRDMLVCLSLAKLDAPATLDQICLFLKFVFPALAGFGVIETFKEEFLGGAETAEYMRVQRSGYLTTYTLNQERKESIKEKLLNFTKDNYEEVQGSLLNPSYMEIVLPGLKQL